MIAGDLFHRQPLLRELKEVDSLLSEMPDTQVVLIAGNHDYIKKDSYYNTYEWSDNVHMLKGKEMQCVRFPDCRTAVYGCSYHDREIHEKTYAGAYAEHREPYEILLLHGGDEKHVPIRKEELMDLGYDYVALGHIHKPQELVPGMIAWSGAPEPIDRNDTGAHGYIRGEINSRGCHTKFVPYAVREYKHVEIPVDAETTAYSLKEKIRNVIREEGDQHLYKIILTGFSDPDLYFDHTSFDNLGNIVEIVDETIPYYNFQKIYQQNKNNILGGLIRSFEGCKEGSLEYQALCEGVQALMETRRA